MDAIKIEILADGTIKSETDKVSAPNHTNAESFLTQMAKLAGGPAKRVSRGDTSHKATHTHSHDETHQH